MNIYRNNKDGKLYYVYQTVVSMCLCGDTKMTAYPYKHNNGHWAKTIKFYKDNLLKKFTLISKYNGLP